MAFLHDLGTAFKALWTIVKNTFTEKAQSAKTYKSDRSSIVLLMILIGCGLVYGGYKGYQWMESRREAQAQRAFADVLALAEQAGKTTKQWADVEAACTLGYEQNRSSKLAPFFLIYRADALVAQGKIADAMTVMEDALSKMSSSNPVRALYAVKLALMKLDSADQAVKAAGMQELEEIAGQKNAGSDSAAYYVGLHFWLAGDIAKAKDAWKSLQADDNKENVSPFVAMVAEKLKSIE